MNENESPLKTLSEAAKLIGFEGADPGRKLRRYLLGREAGRRILIGSRRGAERLYHVSMVDLREACPELFNRPERIALALRRWLGSLQQELALTRSAVEQIERQVRLLSESVRALAERSTMR